MFSVSCLFVLLFHALLAEEDILRGAYDIHWLERWLDTKLAEA